MQSDWAISAWACNCFCCMIVCKSSSVITFYTAPCTTNTILPTRVTNQSSGMLHDMITAVFMYLNQTSGCAAFDFCWPHYTVQQDCVHVALQTGDKAGHLHSCNVVQCRTSRRNTTIEGANGTVTTKLNEKTSMPDYTPEAQQHYLRKVALVPKVLDMMHTHLAAKGTPLAVAMIPTKAKRAASHPHPIFSLATPTQMIHTSRAATNLPDRHNRT